MIINGVRDDLHSAGINLLRLAGLNIGWIASVAMDCESTWPMGIATVLERSLTIPLHGPIGMHNQIAKFMGPTWGPSGSCLPPDGPHVGPMNLAIRVCLPIGVWKEVLWKSLLSYTLHSLSGCEVNGQQLSGCIFRLHYLCEYLITDPMYKMALSAGRWVLLYQWKIRGFRQLQFTKKLFWRNISYATCDLFRKFGSCNEIFCLLPVWTSVLFHVFK